MATNASEWKGKKGRELDLPSGNTCLVRNPGIQTFLKTGVIPDSLTGLVREAIQGKKEDLDLTDIVKKEEDLNVLFDLFDKILLAVVIEPKVHPIPRWTKQDQEAGRCGPEDLGKEVPFGQREEDKLYVDDVDFEDKAFIFQFAVGGTTDLESFRDQQREAVETVRSGSKLALSAEPAS